MLTSTLVSANTTSNIILKTVLVTTIAGIRAFVDKFEYTFTIQLWKGKMPNFMKIDTMMRKIPVLQIGL
jgi:hypothetical protein